MWVNVVWGLRHFVYGNSYFPVVTAPNAPDDLDESDGGICIRYSLCKSVGIRRAYTMRGNKKAKHHRDK